MIRLPPLPTPTIVDGRRLYSAGDMRAYGLACSELDELDEPATLAPESISAEDSKAVLDDLMNLFGMKK